MESYFKSYLDGICQDTERVEKLTTRSNLMIETTRLIIRPFRKEDADALYRIKTDPQVMEFCPDFLDVDAKREDMDSYIHAFQRIEENGDTDTWG